MIKTVRQTGFKYLCKCSSKRNHITYKGSGVYWRRVLKCHPEYIIDTEVLGLYNTKEELRESGLYYSNVYDVVNSKEWANCIPEIGDGGSTTKGRIGIHDPITKEERFINKNDLIPKGWIKGRKPKGPRNPEVTKRIVESQTGQKRTEETKEKMRNANRRTRKRVECRVCGKQITLQNIKRHMEKTHGNILLN